MNKINLFFRILLLLFLITTGHNNNLNIFAQNNFNSSSTIYGNLEEGFQNPPIAAKPRVFWWWLNSMATKKSITRDLEELKAKGFGGALIVDAGSSSYKIAKKSEAGPVFGSKQWIDNFVFALKEADRLGLEMSFAIQSGWNPGGPTVKPENAFKKIVWNDTIVEGPIDFNEKLSQPKGEHYSDIVVQAFPFNSENEKKYLMNWEHKSFNKRFKGFDEYSLHILREQNDSLVNDFDLKTDSFLDITHKLNSQGVLSWRVPKGKYKILRIGHVLTGAEVSTSSDGYSGLSLDHMSAEALELFFKQQVDPILDSAKEYIGKSLKYLQTDSWEMGRTNWTNKLRKEFIERRGYDPQPYLAVLTGQIVDNREISNRFLYDFRKTIGDCVADRNYALFSKLAKERGLKIHPESGGPHAAPIDGLKCLGRNDFPMGEYWARSNTHRFKEEHRLFVKQSASAAHIYGKRFVAAEGPTSIGPQWERSPKDLKSVIDRNFCEGINRFYWHTFTSTPEEFGKPGNAYFAGTHFNTNVTWWNQSNAFVDYLGKSSFLLSQGLFEADVVIYYGDDVPVFANRKKIPDGLGFGYDYDDCNAEVILTRMDVKDGKIVLPDGMSYHILQIPNRKAITLEVLQKLEQLVLKGATISGQKPQTSTGLRDYPKSDRKIKILADKLWGYCDGKTITENSYGKGKVIWGKPMREELLTKGVLPDFNFTSSQDSTQLDYIHRSADGVDIYFVVNRLARKGIFDTKYRYFTNLPDRYEQVNCSFRITGKVPEIWDPMTGNIETVKIYNIKDGKTIVPLNLDPEGSKFVIFRKEIKDAHIISINKDGESIFPVSKSVPELFSSPKTFIDDNEINLECFESGNYQIKFSDDKVETLSVEHWENKYIIDGDWNVSFDTKWGGPKNKVFKDLISWTESENDGIKYYSGTAEYKIKFILPELNSEEKWKYYIDLGNVQDLAEVKINGKELGILWMPPYKTNISETVKPGENELSVKVTNLWPNRIIGDQFLPKEKRYTKSNIEKFNKEDPLRASGLLSPVELIISKIIKIK